MNRYVIGSLWDRINRNGANANFRYLFEGRQKIDELNNRAGNILNEAKQTNDMNKDVQRQINTLIAESGTSDTEVIQARIDESGTEHTVLKERLDKSDEKNKEDITYSKVIGSGDNEDIWHPKVMKSLNDYFQNGDGFQLHRFFELYDMFDKFHIDNPDYISKEVKGVIFEGRYDFPVYEYKPENGYSHTVILSAGLHGDERVGIIALYEILRSVVEDWEESPQLAYIRNNVRLVVMPLVNPYGIAYIKRTNGNDVDLNRNFNYKHASSTDVRKGPSPASEIETQYVQQVLEEYSDAITYLDFHNMAEVGRGSGYSNVSYIPELLPFKRLELERVKKSINPVRYDIRAYDEPSAFNYAVKEFAMNSFAPEYMPGHNATAFGAEDMRLAIKFFGNAVFRFARMQDKVDLGLEEEPISIVRWDTKAAGAGTNVPLDSYGRLYLGSLIPRKNGMLKVTYNITFVSPTTDTTVFFTPKLYQKDNRSGDFQETTVLSVFENRFGAMSSGGNTQSVTCTAIMPLKLYKGAAHFELHGRCRNGSAEVIRMRSIVEFIPSERQDNVIVYG